VTERFRFVRAHEAEHAVRTMCRVLGVSKAGYYAWATRQVRPPSGRAAADAALAAAIGAVHAESRRTYGSPRVHAALRARGTRVGAKRVARLMRARGLRARAPRRFRPATTQSAHAFETPPNALARRFGVGDAAHRAPDRVWVGDVTYLRTLEGWLYLAVVLDLASRRVVGWAMRHTLERGLTLDALRMAAAARRPAPGVLHHTDRGSQYACGEYRALLAAHGMRCSMSRVGDCWDNAVAESFFATLKRELPPPADGAAWPTRDAARSAVFEYIEAWYNRRRLHSSLGYLSPVEYEAQLGSAAA